MSAALVISQRAELDLARHYRWYPGEAGLEIAERFLVAFDASAARLAMFPSTGWRCRFRAPELAGMRCRGVQAPFGRHLIFYRDLGVEVSIERVMHGARDLRRRMLENPE